MGHRTHSHRLLRARWCGAGLPAALACLLLLSTAPAAAAEQAVLGRISGRILAAPDGTNFSAIKVVLVQFGLYRPNALLWSLVAVAPLTPLINRTLPGTRYDWHRPVTSASAALLQKGRIAMTVFNPAAARPATIKPGTLHAVESSRQIGIGSAWLRRV